MRPLSKKRACIAALVFGLSGIFILLNGKNVVAVEPSSSDKKKPLTAQEFLQTEAASYFKKNEYPKALKALKKLAEEYPEDALIQRYLGITYFKLGQFEEALESFNTAKQIAPESAAVQFYLGETFIALEKLSEAEETYEAAVRLDPMGSYGLAGLERLQLLKSSPEEIKASLPEPEKRWEGRLMGGYEYDWNATFNANDGDLNSGEDQDSARYQTELELRYEILSRPQGTLELSYSYAQSLHNELRDLNTYSNTWAAAWSHYRDLGNRPLFFEVSEGLTHVTLHQKFFLFSNTLSATTVYSLHPRYTPVLVYTFSYNEFDDTADSRDLNGRDGFTNSVLLLNMFYLNKAETLYITIGYEYQHDHTFGDNYIRDVHGNRTSLHFPFLFRTEGEMGFRYFHDDRPAYVADTEDGPRRDDVWELTASLTRKLTKQLSLKGFYTYERAFGKNNSFEYIRPFGGFSLELEF